MHSENLRIDAESFLDLRFIVPALLYRIYIIYKYFISNIFFLNICVYLYIHIINIHSTHIVCKQTFILNTINRFAALHKPQISK